MNWETRALATTRDEAVQAITDALANQVDLVEVKKFATKFDIPLSVQPSKPKPKPEPIPEPEVESKPYNDCKLDDCTCSGNCAEGCACEERERGPLESLVARLFGVK